MDLKEYCRRRDLELYELPNGKVVKPKANFSFTLDQKRVVCEWIRGLKMPDGYASNLGRCVDMNEGKLCGMKSYDCHVFMERLLPIAFIALPEPIWKPLTELSIFFRDLCSTVLRVKDLVQMEHNISIILCKLERIFPPSFFDSMEHLPIHLPYEARVGGPIQYRWMYPFERFLNKLKKMVKNKARVEGSICEAYLAQETSYFCSYYFEPHIHAMGIGANRNDGREEYEIRRQPTLSIFSQFGHPSGQCRTRYLTDAELTVATLHILLNCDEVKPYLDMFVQYVRASTPGCLSDAQIDALIEASFVSWFKDYVHNPCSMIQNQHLNDLAWGPMRVVKTWPMYFIGGFKFHTHAYSEGKKTINSGVCVKSRGHGDNESDFYGILKEVVELQYPGQGDKTVMLFYCEWFDPIINRGMKVHKQYDIIEIRHHRRYAKFDPFILPQHVVQVYYVPYPGRIRDKVEWWVVIKTRPRGRVDNDHTLEPAFQDEEMSRVNAIDDNEAIENLRDSEGLFKEVDAYLEGSIDNEEKEDEEEVEGEEEEEEEEEEEYLTNEDDSNRE